MSPPAPMECSSPECTFVTPAGIPTFELTLKCLELHNQASHSYAKSDGHGKTEKLRRPIVNTGMSESEWTFFIHKWDRYTRNTKLSDTQKLDELWACMDADVERLAFNDGLTATSTNELLTGLKKLAVTELHPSVHVMALHEMRQARGESAKAFSARVKGIATNCNLVKKCTKTSCNEQVSFLEETCYHVVLAGLQDTNLREKVLTQAMLNNVTDLPSLITYTSAEESAKLTKPMSQVAAAVKTPPRARLPCSHCGEARHGENNEHRQEKCKAFGKTCQRCNKLNHFASQCRSARTPPSQPRPQVSEITDDGNDPEVSGFICHMKAVITTPYTAAPHIAAMKDTAMGPVTTFPVPHFVYNQQRKRWSKQPPKNSPTITVTLSLDRRAYTDLGLNKPDLIKKPSAGIARARTGTADTGAQLTVINES